MKVGALAKKFPSLDVDSNLMEATALLTKMSVDSLVIIRNSVPVGVLGSFDLLEKEREEVKLEDIPVRSVMNTTLLIIDADQTPEEAAEIMLAHKHWMAIVTEKGVCKGVVTAGGLLKDIN